MNGVRVLSGLIFWTAALVLTPLLLLHLANFALGYVGVGEEIGRQLSERMGGGAAQFERAQLRVSWRGLFVRARGLRLAGAGGNGIFAPQADFFFGKTRTGVSLRAPRLTLTAGFSGEGAPPLPLVGEEWSLTGDDAVFVLPENSQWLPAAATADFTVVRRGGLFSFAIAGRGDDDGDDSSFSGEWRDGVGGRMRLVFARAQPLERIGLSARGLRLTVHADFGERITVAAALAAREFRGGGVAAGTVAAAARAELPPAAELIARLFASQTVAVTVSLRALSAVAAEGVPPADITAAAVFRFAEGGGWSLTVSRLLAANVDGALALDGAHFSGGGEGGTLGSVNINGRAAFSAAAAYRYLPPSKARAWLEESLAAGTMERAAFAIGGTPQQLAAGNGWNLTAAFSGGEIVIGEGWPRAKGLAGALFLRDERVTIIGEGAFADVAVPDVTAVIDDFHSAAAPELVLDLRATPSPLAEYRRAAYAVTALRAELAAAQTARISGGGLLAMSLRVPLSAPEQTQTRLSLMVGGGTLALGDAPLPTLTALSGTVTAADAALGGSFRGLLFGEAAGLFFDGGGEGGGTLTARIAAQRAVALADLQNAALARIGDDAVSGVADFTLRQAGGRTEVAADLRGVESLLPPPLQKSAGTDGELLLTSGGGGLSLSLSLPEEGTTVRFLQEGDSAAVGINRPLPIFAGESEKVKIAAAGEGWNLDEWLRIAGDGGGAEISLSLRGAQLLGMRHDFLRLLLRAPDTDGARTVRIASPLMRGTAVFAPGTVRAEFSELFLPAPGDDDDGDSDGDGVDSVDDIDSVDSNDDNAPSFLFSRAISLRAESFAVGAATLGAAVLRGSPEGEGWRIGRLALADGGNVLRFSGYGDARGTTLSAGLTAPDLAQLLARLNLTGVVESGGLTMRGTLSWAGAPSAPSLAKLRGGLRLAAKDVRYLGIREDVGGLIALFSPASLFSLGFTELGRPGVRFDIGGEIALAGGFASSESLTMENEDIQIMLGGQTDMLRRRHNIRGRVLPGNRLLKTGSAISLGTTLAIGAAINPPIFLASVLLGKILEKPLAEIGSYDYEITGTWDDPQYQELGFSENQS